MSPTLRRAFGALVVLTVVGCVAAGDGIGQGRLRERLTGGADARQGGASAAGDLAAETLTVGGLEREYFVHVPAGLEGVPGLPAVFVFHGGGGDGRSAEALTGMAQAADAGGFVAVFPSSAGEQWTDGRAESAAGPDDVAFARALVDEVGSRYGVDRSRVFAAGMSNGGMFTQRLACDAADAFRAFAAVAANMPRDLAPRCAPSRPVPIALFAGTADPIMPFGGGSITTGRSRGAGGEVLSAQETEAFWSRVDGCLPGAAARSLPDAAADGTSVAVEQAAACTGGAEVSLYVIEGGGHTWPGGPVRRPRLAGAATQDISGTAEVLGFFRRHGL